MTLDIVVIQPLVALIAVWLIHRFPGEMTSSAGWTMAEQVVLGAVIGGVLAAVFELVPRQFAKNASRSQETKS